MNLDLGVLWLEDSFSEQEEASLRRRIQDSGFVARIFTLPNSTGLTEIARKHQLYHLFDLILLDYKLQGEDGDDLAPRIREMFPSTTILFYSGNYPERELRALIADRQVEGVYCSERLRFIDRAGALIDQTAKSLDRLSGMRGLAMRVVAECDEIMKSAMLSMAKRDPNCASKSGELDADVLSFIDELALKYKAAVAGDLAGRFETRAVDSSKVFKHFRRLTQVVTANPATFGLDQGQVERLREMRKATAQYDDKVLKRRNVLGHVVEEQLESGWVLKGSDEISIADFPEIRRAFAAHIDALREIGSLVVKLDFEETR